MVFVLVAAILLFSSASLSRPASLALDATAQFVGGFNATQQQLFEATQARAQLEATPRAGVTGEARRVILRDATLNITVSEVEKTVAEITTMTSEMGGWVVGSSTRRTTDSRGQPSLSASVAVRIPAERLDEAISRIKASALIVNVENVTGQDVTQQYVDLSSRLKNLQAAEEQLQTIMDGATKTEDVLAVYDQLVRVRGEIESITGQLQYFDEASAYSLLHVDIVPEAPSPVTVQTEGWNPLRTVENALGGLLRLIQFLIDLALTLAVYLGPILVMVVGWLVYRRFKRRQT